MWRRVIDKMYDAEDARILEKRFTDQMGVRESEVLDAMGENRLAQVSNRIGGNKRISRSEALQMVESNQSQVSGKLLYNDF